MVNEKNKSLISLILLYFLAIIFWILFFILTKNSPTYEGPVYLYILRPFLVLMTAIPLFGGIVGLLIASKWGFLKSVFGRGIFFLSLGNVAWGLGMIVWNYYLFFTEIEVPYPSLADAVFVLSWPFWALGVFYIGKVAGIKYGFREFKGRIISFFIPILAVLISYFLLFRIARNGEFDLNVNNIELFFNIFYPVGDIVILSLIGVVYFLSKNFLGGIYKKSITILFFGFLMNYISDFIFSYTNSTETYFNGHIVDLLYTTTMFTISLSILSFQPKLKKG